MEYNKEGIDVIFTTLQKEYDIEDSRNKQLETKAQVLLAVSGVLSSSLMLLLKTIFDTSSNKIIEIPFIFISLILLIVAMYFFLSVFNIEKFNQLNHENLLSYKAINFDSYELKYHISHDYLDCIKINSLIGNKKTDKIKNGNKFIFLSIIFFVISFSFFITGTFFDVKNNAIEISSSINEPNKNECVESNDKNTKKIIELIIQMNK